MKFNNLLILCTFGLIGASAQAEEPAGYYQSCIGKSGAALLSQLQSVVGSHTTVSYDGLWDIYPETDARADGTIWDMYSTKAWVFGKNKCGNYKNVGDCYNREHSFPKSWFDDKKPMYSDAFHLYPTDGKVNGQRLNHPYGECANGTTLPGSGNVKALGRLGASTFPGYSGTVFEPVDEYKGDFARSYFYMAAAYNSQFGSWSSPMLAGNSYPGYKQWAINLLLKWHRQDPVSEKEIKRNDAVYKHQKNRNPFIDHPELAEHIWGDKTGSGWTGSDATEPTLLLPAAGSTVNIGTTVTGVARTATVMVKGQALEADVKLTVSGNGFSVSPATITRTAAQSGDGAKATVTFKSTTTGDARGTLTITTGDITRTVALTASAVSTLPAGPVTGLGDTSFGATWSYVGDADSRGEYILDVRHEGVSLDEYPCAVRATDEYYTVEGLEPLTTYTYTVSSANLTSAPVTVTTLAPQPDVDILFDGDLRFTAAVGEPSEAAELLVDIINITDPVVFTVNKPFQLSVDKTEWSTTVTLDPEEDRMYLRMLSDNPGTFSGTIKVSAGSYTNDDVDFEGTAVSSLAFHEDFEADASHAASYKGVNYQGTAANWNLSDAGIWADQDRGIAYERTQSVRLGSTTSSIVEMTEDNPAGFGIVTLWAAVYKTDADASFCLEYSSDAGQTWKSAGEATISGSTYKQYTFTANVAGPARIRVRQTAGKRWMLDEIEGTAFTSLVPDFAADYHRWDAYCAGGRLVIETSEEVAARVYALDGTEVFAGSVAPGTTGLSLAAGLYIVAVDDFARRVMVK